MASSAVAWIGSQARSSQGFERVRFTLLVASAAFESSVSTLERQESIVPGGLQLIERALAVALRTILTELTFVGIFVATDAILLEADVPPLPLGQKAHLGVLVAFGAIQLEVGPLHLETDPTVVEVLDFFDAG